MSSQVDAFTHLEKKDSSLETIFERFSEKPAKMVKGQLMGAEIEPVSENKDRLTAPASGNSKNFCFCCKFMNFFFILIFI